MRAASHIIASMAKRYPVKFCFLILCIMLLAGYELWEHFSLLPAYQWNVINLKEITVPDPKSFSFAVFGDNRNSKDVFVNILKLIDHDVDTDFAIGLGDMVQRGTKERYRYFFHQVEKHLSIPLLTVMGSHERLGKGPNLYRAVFGLPYFSLKIGRNLFIILDNSDQKGLSPEQEQWLLHEFKKSGN